MKPFAGALALLALLFSASPSPAQEGDGTFRGGPIHVQEDELRDAPSGPPSADEPERVFPSTTAAVLGTGYTVIPLPAFVYNRNEGVWAGGLLPIFRANEKGEVEDIYAPLYLHNNTVGETFTLNYFGYREHSIQYHAILSKATRIEHFVDLGYQDNFVGEHNFLVAVQFVSNTSAFNRFYGFGSGSSQSNESNYALDDNYFKFAGGIHLGDDGAFLVTERFRNVNVDNGPSIGLPQTRDEFSTAPGIDGAQVWGQGLELRYDTRDNQLTPFKGTFASLFTEALRNYDAQDKNNWFRITGDARRYIPHVDGRAIFVSRLMVDGVLGEDKNQRGVPFYCRPTLGGETTLRGFGNQRFVNNIALLANLEERISVFSRSILGNLIEFELAPFLDMGRVGSNFNLKNTLKNPQINPGMGARLLARPNIAARLDVAEGKEGANVFVGLDYPF